jgi:transcriptional regulator with XRE-family HTH domain
MVLRVFLGYGYPMARPAQFLHPLRAVAQIIGDSQSQMAKRLGISAESIKSICIGRMAISPSLSVRIRETTGADIPPGIIKHSMPPKDREGHDFTLESYESVNARSDWEHQAADLSHCLFLTMEAAASKKKSNLLASEIESFLVALWRKHRLHSQILRIIDAQDKYLQNELDAMRTEGKEPDWLSLPRRSPIHYTANHQKAMRRERSPV